MKFIEELQRRNVLRVGAAYVVTAWLIVQVAETLFPAYGLSDTALRAVINVLAIGLVPVLVLAWVFEWTPEGLKRESEIDVKAPTSLRAAKRLDRVILVVLAIALAYFAFDKFVLAPQKMAKEVAEAREEGRTEARVESYGDKSIAVLAFRDMSPDKDQEYLSDGLAEEILNLLAKIPDLRVISRTSAFSYKGKDIPIPTIATQLNVAHILEGSVRKAGNRIRVTAQLIEARSDTHIWSETYDRDLDDIFAIQDELAAAMVDELQLTLLEAAPTSDRIDPEAYMLWMEGRHFAEYIDAGRAVELLERAVAIQPDFADAWRDLSWVYWQMSPTLGDKDHEGDEYYAKGIEAENRVKEIDPDHPWVLMSRSFEPLEGSNDWAEAARRFQHALEVHPEDGDLQRIGMMLARWIYRDDIALALGRWLVARDPLCTSCSYHYARSLLVAGKYVEAELEIERFRALVPGGGGQITLAKSKLLAGDVEGARQVFAAMTEGESRFSEQARVKQRYGELLIALVTRSLANSREEVDAYLAGENVQQFLQEETPELYGLAGNFDAAFEFLGELRRQSHPWRVAWTVRAPFLETLHADPRWDEHLEAIGLAPHQLAEVEFNPPLPGFR